MSKQEQLEYLNLLANNELTIARLYQTYGEEAGQKVEFWMKLSREEILHSEWITTLAKQIEKDGIVFRQQKFEKNDIQESINEIQEEIDRVSKAGMDYLSHEGKLVIALGLEKDMLEKELFKSFETDNGMLKKVLKQLTEETEKHKKRLAEELENEKNKQA